MSRIRGEYCLSWSQTIKRDFGGVALAMIFSVACVATYSHMRTVDQPNFEGRLELHRQIIDGTAVAPYRYRILVPFICEALTRLFSAVLPLKQSFILAYALYDLAAILFFMLVLFAWLRVWFSRERALVGLLFVAGVISMALRDHYFQPWSLLDPGLFTAGLLAIYRKRWWILAALTLVATLNRETGIFLPVAFLFSNVNRGGGERDHGAARVRKWPALLAGYVFIWVFVYGAIRVLRGATDHMYTLGEIWMHNTAKHNLVYTPVNLILFLGAFWAFAAMGYRHAPAFLRRITWVIVPYVIMVALFGMWREVRLLMPLYPILVALGLCYLYHGRVNTDASRSEHAPSREDESVTARER
jgi:hypothetical protein